MACRYWPWLCVSKSPVPAEYPCSFKKVLNQNIRSKADVISLAKSVGPWDLCKTVVKSLQLLGWVRTTLVALKGWQRAVRFAGCTCVYLIHSHLTCRELWIQLENNTHLQLIAWDISFNSSWRELDAWIGSELHFPVIMLLIMANLLFVNNVLSKVGRHDTHLLGGGSDFLLGITQNGVCHIPVCLSKKHLNLSFCGNEDVQRACQLSVWKLCGIHVSLLIYRGLHMLQHIFHSIWNKSVRRSVLEAIKVFIPIRSADSCEMV